MTDRKLHIGAKRIFAGWEGLNVTPFDGLDHIMDARDLSAFPDKTFAVVYASHVLEHFDYKDELLTVLKEWHRVLVPGGKLMVSVPDLETLCRLFVDRALCDVNDRFRLMRMLFGGHTDPFDYHQVGLNWEFLTHYLSEAGFESVQRVNTFGLFDDTSGMRFKGQLISLNLVAKRRMLEHSYCEPAAGTGSAAGEQCSVPPIKNNLNMETLLIEKARRLREAGQAKAALRLLEDVVAQPGLNSALLRERGLGYACLGEHKKAVDNLKQAQLVLPEDFEALFVVATTLFQLGRAEESLATLERLLACVPDLALLHGLKGQCLSSLKRGFEAHVAFLKARQLQPDSANLLIQHGNHLVTWCHAEQAVALFEHAIALEPDNPSAYYDLGRAHRFLGRADKALHFFRKALELAPNNRAFGNGYLFDLCYQDQLSAEQVADEHRRLGRQQYPDSGANRRMPAAAPVGSRLRIGYLSADFFMHPVMRFLEPVLKNHDRSRFDIYCYANVTKPDEVTQKVQQMGLVWRDIKGHSAQTVAAQIRADGIDVLVDLSGHTAGNRLDVCALKPAPVQVSWLGYPHSTGLQQIDWYLSDSWCDPPGMTDHLYVEQVWRLPGLFCCYQPHDPSPTADRVADKGLTFGCFNNFAKATERQLLLWADLLRNLPASRLFLKNPVVGENGPQQRLTAFFEGQGVSADRLLFSAFTPAYEDHLACYQQVDIALDTFPYNGTTTTCEALWMGVPVVTLAGKTHHSRVGVALLHAVGLDDLVADSPDQYVAIALQLAGDTARLKELRVGLRARLTDSAVMAHAAFTRQLEEAFAVMSRQGKMGCS